MNFVSHFATRRFAALALVLGLVASASPAAAAPVFYLSQQATGATPGLLTLIGIPANVPRTMYLWVNTDVRLAGVSLDLIETGGGIKFTGVDVANPSGPPARWTFLDGPQLVANSSITNIGGAAIPGLNGDGVGPGTVSVANGTNVLLASINYMATASATSNLRLQVGSNTISDFNGNFSQVRFGTTTASLVNGDAVGQGGKVGALALPGIEAPIITPIDLGDIPFTSPIHANLIASNGPVTWSNLTPTVGSPALAATLSPDGVFSWSPTGSLRGSIDNAAPYAWSATATNSVGATTGLAIRFGLVGGGVIFPEPSTLVLLGVALIGGIGLRRGDQFRRRV